MQNSLYLNAAGSLAAQTRMDVAANNIANVDTPGFRRQFAVFQERMAEVWEKPKLTPSWDDVLNDQGGGLFVHEVTYTDEVGTLRSTGNDLDLAIQGQGWFSVEQGGETLYTRAGNFARSADGTLVTADGQSKLLDKNGDPIVVPSSVGEVGVQGNGTIRFDDVPVTQLSVRGSNNYRQFVPTGDNLYRYIGSGTPDVSDATIQQGFLEASTVSPVSEMVNLIRTHRAYESNQRMITQQDQVMGRVVNDVGRIG